MSISSITASVGVIGLISSTSFPGCFLFDLAAPCGGWIMLRYILIVKQITQKTIKNDNKKISPR